MSTHQDSGDNLPAAGWYPDPAGTPNQLRYWDGREWTDQAQGQRPGGPATPGHGPGQGAYGPANPPAVTTPDGRELASWGARIGAYLIDGLILGLLGMVLNGPLLYLAMRRMSENLRQLTHNFDPQQPPPPTLNPFTLYDGAWGYFLGMLAIGAVLTMLYQVLFLRLKQATPGKMMVGLRVEPRQAPGPLSWGTVFKRWAVQTLPGYLASSLWQLLDGLWPLWDDKRQALHEKWPDTNVVVHPRR